MMRDTLLPPQPVYSLFSGGKDSFACTDVLAQAGMLKGCVLIDTGIAADTWREDIIALCEQYNWPYEIVPTNIRFEWLVWKYGFPGPGFHREAMNYLKGRAVKYWGQQHKGEALASGVRTAESQRRGWSAKFESVWEGVTVYAPLLYWTTKDTIAYGLERDYQKPRTYQTLGISGDCLCGAFAQGHEPEAIQEHYPIVHSRILNMKGPDRFSWGERSIEKIDQTLPLEFDETTAIACFDCWRGA
jgi:3'-phosphoadenosine 5'-phosphosulfate sulfotransferase (PAPS reductase)/FAD synthetase